MYVAGFHVDAGTPCVPGTLGGQDRASDPLELSYGSWELPCGYWEWNCILSSAHNL